MAKTMILIHGRAQKPTKEALKGLWLEALRFGLERDHADKLDAFDEARIEFIYYGDINNNFLSPGDHDVHVDEVSRRETLARLKEYTRDDFFNANIYNGLPGKSSTLEFLADVLSKIGAFFHISEPAIYRKAPDMKEYWPTFPIWLNIPLSKSSAFFKPLSICETLAVGMAIISP